jgi:DNA polymerase epsilon subunit 1
MGHLGTWLSSSSSVFYDPALHSVFAHFLSIIFHQMVNHFDGRGLTVVYADQSRIILNIGTLSPDAALAELKAKPLLRWVDLTVVNDFPRLVWLDQFNHQGLLRGNVYLHSWNILRFLSEKHGNALKDCFNDLLVIDIENLASCFHNAPVDYPPSISDRLFKLADDYRYAPSVRENVLRNPQDLTRSDFMLLINTFFYLVENVGDTTLQHSISALRGSVLKIVGLGEFDPRSRYTDPSLSLVVPSVLCKHCLSVHNVDLLRDEEILQGNWICAFCKQPYDTRILERRVYEEFARRVEMYQTQDLRCSRCSKVQASRLALICDDGGEMKNSVLREDVRQFMNTVVVTARYHELQRLEEVVTDMVNVA